MVEVEVTHRDEVHGTRIEPRHPKRGPDRGALVPPHGGIPGIEPLPDPRLDQHAPRRRLDQQAVERLEDAPVGVQLSLGPRAPQDPGHRPEDRSGVGAERARLHEGDGRAAAEIGLPVDGVVDTRRQAPSRGVRARSKSAWDADAVGSVWPWYLDPRPLLPYGRSTGELIRKKLIWPIRMPT